jgi:hypothetical protein
LKTSNDIVIYTNTIEAAEFACTVKKSCPEKIVHIVCEENALAKKFDNHEISEMIKKQCESLGVKVHMNTKLD